MSRRRVGAVLQFLVVSMLLCAIASSAMAGPAVPLKKGGPSWPQLQVRVLDDKDLDFVLDLDLGEQWLAWRVWVINPDGKTKRYSTPVEVRASRGKWRVIFQLPSDWWTFMQVDGLRQDGDTATIDFAGTPGEIHVVALDVCEYSRVTATVTDESGAPAPGVLVWLDGLTLGGLLHVEEYHYTNSSGQAVWPELFAGSYTVSLGWGPYAALTLPVHFSIDEGEEVEVSQAVDWW